MSSSVRALKIPESPAPWTASLRRLVLELSSRCNLRCIMCAQSHRQMAGMDMEEWVFDKLHQLFPALDEVALFGWGESLLNKRFGSFLGAISDVAGLKSYLVTNGYHLDRAARAIVENRLTYLAVSIDGFAASTHNSIRRGSDFDRVLKNVGLVARLKEQAGGDYPVIRIEFVAMRNNIEELPDLIRLAKHLGAGEVKVVYATIYDESLMGQSLWWHRELAAEVFARARSQAVNCQIALSLPPLIGEDPAQDSPHRLCTAPWEEVFVSSQGKVRPCIISTEIIGDLAAQSMSDIYYGPAYERFRGAVNGDQPPSDCASCHQNRRINVNRYQAHFRIGADVP